MLSTRGPYAARAATIFWYFCNEIVELHTDACRNSPHILKLG